MSLYSAIIHFRSAPTTKLYFAELTLAEDISVQWRTYRRLCLERTNLMENEEYQGGVNEKPECIMDINSVCDTYDRAACVVTLDLSDIVWMSVVKEY